MPSSAGILYVILHVPESLLVPYADVIEKTLMHVLYLQDPSGNWPAIATSTLRVSGAIGKSNDLVQYAPVLALPNRF